MIYVFIKTEKEKQFVYIDFQMGRFSNGVREEIIYSVRKPVFTDNIR